MDLNTLFEQNSWWQTPENIATDPAITLMNEMAYIRELHLMEAFNVNADLVYILRGPMQVGKTTMLKNFVRELLKEGIFHQNIFYFSCNLIETNQELAEVLNLYINWIRSKNAQRVFILADEIDSVKDWQRAVKHLADLELLKFATLILTSSNAVNIKISTERLSETRSQHDEIDRFLLPMTFQDYVRTVAPSLLDKFKLLTLLKLNSPRLLDMAIHQQEIDRHFHNYLLSGGFPASVNALNADQFIPPHIYNAILQWVTGDLAKLGKKQHFFKQITKKLIESLTIPVSWQSIFKTSDIGSHNTVIEYVDYLERSFVLSIFFCLDINTQLPAYRKNKKIYFADPFIYHTLHAWLKDSSLPFSLAEQEVFETSRTSKLVENAIAVHLKRKFREVYYWKNRKEIDFVIVENGRIIPIEVKYRRAVPIGEITYLKKFPQAVVVTQSELRQDENILFIPAGLFCLCL